MRNQNPHKKVTGIMKRITPSMRYDGKEDFTSWQKRAREKLSELLGMQYFEKCDEDFKIEFTEEKEKYTETRFSFQSEEGYYVPCHFLVPKEATKPLPVVICLQGHSKGMHISLGNPKFEGDVETIAGGDRAFALRVIEEGYCALTVEQRGMGECGGTPEGPQCYVPTMANLLIGRTTIGERVWDISRTIDALEKHFPQADSDKIICMGNSGGGTATFYAACLEERIKAAMPSCAICTYDDSIAAMSHCSCNFIPGIRRYFDMCDLAGLIAPKILVVVSGKEDDIFPINPAKETVEFASTLYAAAGAGDKIAMVEGNGGHRFYADDAWPVMNTLLERCGIIVK